MRKKRFRQGSAFNRSAISGMSVLSTSDRHASPRNDATNFGGEALISIGPMEIAKSAFQRW